MNFDEAVQYLLGLGHETLTIKLGLRNTKLLLQALDNPERAFLSVQIAGTNGKGSTAAMLDSICRAAGIKTGLYTSPHLVSIAERIRISGSEISPQDFARHATTVRTVAEELRDGKQIETLPTFFEHVTAIALFAFREAGVEVAILETGLGGRLDSTTAANAAIVGITPIAMDHEEYLGDTLTSIAREKAAVIRPGVTAVLAEQPPEALAVLLDRCAAVGVQPSLPPSTGLYENVLVNLRGRHQQQNKSVAIRLAEALHIPKPAIIRGLKTVQHGGRLELIECHPNFILDGAHNPAGAEALRDYLIESNTSWLTMIFAAMSNKKLDQLAAVLFPLANCLVLTTLDNPRAAPLEQLTPLAQRFARGAVIETASSTEAVRTAMTQTPPEGLICVTGSLYLIGETRPLILNLAERTA
ncbi:MAG: folylpolyglutamate synthase/dihydrofolate synthase family protein [Pyrinomonadaceae bacterium]